MDKKRILKGEDARKKRIPFVVSAENGKFYITYHIETILISRACDR